jgi:hypothetical protein
MNSTRYVTPEIRTIEECAATDSASWRRLKKEYLAHNIPAIIVRGLPKLTRQSVFDLGGVNEHSSAESAIAINLALNQPNQHSFVQTHELGLHFDSGRPRNNEATTNRVEVGRFAVRLIEANRQFTNNCDKKSDRRHPKLLVGAKNAYHKNLIDTKIFIPVVFEGEVNAFDVLFSRNYGGLVLAHEVISTTPSRLSYVQGVTLVEH